jgi:hypothetical protein
VDLAPDGGGVPTPLVVGPRVDEPALVVVLILVLVLVVVLV